MTVRQKLLLALLSDAGRPVSRTAFQKLAFLLKHEANGAGDAFFDFIPHKYGPYSFGLARDLENLEQFGHVCVEEQQVRLVEATRSVTAREVASLTPSASAAVHHIVSKYASLSQEDLLRDVYTRYRWYASRSLLTHLLPAPTTQRPSARQAIYTCGYQGKTIDAFLAHLIRSRLQCVIDVRANPMSRMYGYAGSTFRRLVECIGLDYVHVPELGVPNTYRTGLGTAQSYQRVLDLYDNEILPNRPDQIEKVISILRSKPSTLLCLEADRNCCHRSRLAAWIEARSELSIIHL